MLKKMITIGLTVLAISLLAACQSDYDNVPLGETTRPPAVTQTAPSEQTTEGTVPDVEVGVGERGDYSEDTAETTAPSTADTTEPESTVPEGTVPDDTVPGETTPEATTPGETTPENEEPGTVTYDVYLHMTEEEQMAYINSFPSIADFFEWLNAAKEEAGADDDTITGEPSIDLGELTP